MLLVLIGRYFNHSHWSVSSLTEQILSPSLSPFPNLPLCPAALVHPLIHLLTHSHLTHTQTERACRRPQSVLTESFRFLYFTDSFILSFIQSLYHLTLQHLSFTNSPSLFFPLLTKHLPIFTPALPHSFLPHTTLSCTSFSLYFLPSLTSPLSFLLLPIALFLSL